MCILQQLTENKPDVEAFTPQDLMSLCEEKGYRLGLIIDLTFTKRYYDPKVTYNGVNTEYGMWQSTALLILPRSQISTLTA